MTRSRSFPALVASLALVVPSGLTASAAAHPAPAIATETSLEATDVAAAAKSKVVKQRVRAMVRALPVRAEKRAGYDRDAYAHWSSQGDGCDTRDLVLIAEAVKKPTVGEGCTLTGGRWRSYYDGQTTTDPSTFDIDHLIPLAEAHDSGAHAWNAVTRERFANDLTDPRALVAVSASSNRSKSDKDFREWLPAKGKCRYLREWVAVKTRWSLSVDKPEKKALRKQAKTCKNPVIKVTKAKIGKGNKGGGTSANGFKVTRIVYDPPGSDTSDTENLELVVIKNRAKKQRNLRSWSITDGAGHLYVFPKRVLKPGQTLTLHSGKGKNKPRRLYAGWGHIWNNSGDSFQLRNPNGKLRHSGAYPGGGSGVATF